ncbi:DMT family transporter [Mesobacillus subterraneus]|uniref:DMT family transporter n=1 Tax=Mesobacillus subterraneus TaxID=285983 RepID=UPI0020405BAB|nr:DMT family transporter [Mesobacillus subterraneus]MCM3665822.1 DMT family transporter [Mesobacillus subterraneus]MCM3684787.1 DMT family transporter [Mesobacillus subterraneus]
MVQRLGNAPYLLLVGAAFFWGGNAVAGKFLAGSLPPVTISFIRLAIGVLIMSPVIIRLFKREMAALRENLKMLVFLAVTGVIGFNLLIYWAVNYTSAINATLLNSTSPLFIFLLSALLIGEKMELKYWVSMAISFIGVLFVITHGSFERMIALQFNTGDLIMVLAVISWALYSIFIKKLSGKMPSLAIFGFTLAIGFLLMIPAVAVELAVEPVDALTLGEWSALFYIGIFPSICSFLLWNRAVAMIGPSKASISLNLIPVFGAGAAFLVLGEVITLPQVIGGCLVFIGVFITSFTKKKSVQLAEEA